jgi:preprotein translocase subunit SecG
MQTLVPLTLGLQFSGWMVGVFVVAFVLVSVILMLTILIQKPQGGGLSAAFGAGAGSGQTAFGTKTGDALTIATISMFAVWVICGVGLNFALAPAKAGTQSATVSGDGTVPPAGNAPAGDTGTNSGTTNETGNTGTTPAQTPASSSTPIPSDPAPAPAPAPADKPADQPKPADPPAGEKPAGEQPAGTPAGAPGGQP